MAEMKDRWLSVDEIGKSPDASADTVSLGKSRNL